MTHCVASGVNSLHLTFQFPWDVLKFGIQSQRPLRESISLKRRGGRMTASLHVVRADYEPKVGNSARSPRKENVPGRFYVDHTCIDCDTCRWMAPEVFSKIGSMSAVHRQPTKEEDRFRALQAMLACPTASIHTTEAPKDIADVHASFPIAVDPVTLPGVFHCGYHSKASYGATSYFVQLPGGNILVDSPRYTESLAKKLEEMGGVKCLFLTHIDDVADHERWAKRFGCMRVLHFHDVNHRTAEVEQQLQGEGPWLLDGFDSDDVQLIFTPGHTQGCVSMHVKSLRVIFTGDHLCFSQRVSGISIMRNVNWFSVERQLESVRKMLPLDFVWLLPGHGRRYHFASMEEKNQQLQSLIEKETRIGF
eukprot:TRINITY_DN1022_c0_g1_i2.p1 TRINITY_DN1022_c0_g1~~TRINITY_DN1022_c0_g1_i2.p1  ORF type:complete len:364 (+),score=89.37 TRINITY_DN1022_c0_g1_i2:209-1300(+)